MASKAATSTSATGTLLLKDGRAAGVVLEDGQQITAKVVVTSLHPCTAFLDQVGRQNLPADFVADIEHWKTRSGVVKIKPGPGRTARLHRRSRSADQEPARALD